MKEYDERIDDSINSIQSILGLRFKVTASGKETTPRLNEVD